MKRTILFASFLILCLTQALATEFIQTCASGQTLRYSITGSNTVEIIPIPYQYEETVDKPAGDLIIPSSVTYQGTTYTVTAIGNFAFSECTNLTSVIIPNSVTSIGIRAFDQCFQLTSIDIPNSVTSIKFGTFMVCISLQEVNLPNTITEIDSLVFYHCTSLTNITIPNSVTTIEYEAFINCTHLAKITIPSSVNTIEPGAFYGCQRLDTIIFESSVPPSIGGHPEYDYQELPIEVLTTRHIFVPCGSANAYRAINVEGWDFANVAERNAYSITAQPSDPEHGSVAFLQQPTCTSPAIIAAIPHQHYTFTSWSDGNTDNPRTIQPTENLNLIANIELPQTQIVHDTTIVTLLLRDSTIIYGTCDTAYIRDTIMDCHNQQLVILANNDTLGVCAGGGSFPLGSTVQILAIPNLGCAFESWSDGNTENPRTVVLSESIELTAIFRRLTFTPETESPSGSNDISDSF